MDFPAFERRPSLVPPDNTGQVIVQHWIFDFGYAAGWFVGIGGLRVGLRIGVPIPVDAHIPVNVNVDTHVHVRANGVGNVHGTAIVRIRWFINDDDA